MSKSLFTQSDFNLLINHGNNPYEQGSQVSLDYQDLYKRFKKIGKPVPTNCHWKNKSWQNSGNALDYIWARIIPYGYDKEFVHCFNFSIASQEDLRGIYIRIDTDYSKYKKIYKKTFHQTAKAKEIWEKSLRTISLNTAINMTADDIREWIKDYIEDESVKQMFNEYIKEYPNTITKQKQKDDGTSSDIHVINEPSSERKNPKTTQIHLPLNLILYGPPGTGKTYNTVNKSLQIVLESEEFKALEVKASKEQDTDGKRKVFTDRFKELKREGRIEFITFHQSMSYEDFVEGIKPITNGKDVTYDVMPGIFKQICEKAKTHNGNNYVLIIDEINRGNVSQIFGELITLIEEDKRLGIKEELTVKLPYSSTYKETVAVNNEQGEDKEKSKEKSKDKEFGVPNNLYIIGTMNTADRSVEALDTALRRRFSFEEMMPKYDAEGMDTLFFNHPLRDILWTINQRIQILKGREQQIGHSYLMKCKKEEDLKRAFKDKIVPLLQEYFYGDYSQIGLVLGTGFVLKAKTSDNIFPEGFESPSLNEVYHLLTDDEWKNLNMVEALRQMKIQSWPNSLAENTNQAGNPQSEQEETKTEDSQEGISENQS